MPYNCAIVDDEQHAIDVLNDYIHETDFLKLTKTFIHPVDAIEGIRKEDKIDFLFLDVDMASMKGTELSYHLRDKAKFIIYASSNLEDDVRAIDSLCESYMGKPVSLKKFTRTIRNLMRMNNMPDKLTKIYQHQLEA